MIFLLDFLLIVNLIIAIRSFKDYSSPPILMGAGMMIAAVIASFYYDEWRLDKMLFTTVMIIGGGMLLFTFYCNLFKKHFKPISLKDPQLITFKHFNVEKLQKFYLFIIIFQIIIVTLKIYFLASFFGSSLSLTGLMNEFREDAIHGKDFSMPSIVRMAGTICMIVSYLTSWLLALQLLSKSRNKFLFKMLICQLVLTMLESLLGGAKGTMFDVLIRTAIIFLVIYYSRNGSYTISRSVKFKMCCALVLSVIFFKAANQLVGRSVDDFDSFYFFAIYCGAEIKIFDKYMQGDIILNNETFGGNTFGNLYASIMPEVRIEALPFQYEEGHFLGNVGTQFYYICSDFGIVGVVVVLFIVGLLSMYFYSLSTRTINEPTTPNPFLLIYSSMGMALFMSFFSSRFTEDVFRFGFVRQSIYIFIIVWFFRKNFLKKI